jgi:hypothetical protein
MNAKTEMISVFENNYETISIIYPNFKKNPKRKVLIRSNKKQNNNLINFIKHVLFPIRKQMNQTSIRSLNDFKETNLMSLISCQYYNSYGESLEQEKPCNKVKNESRKKGYVDCYCAPLEIALELKSFNINFIQSYRKNKLNLTYPNKNTFEKLKSITESISLEREFHEYPINLTHDMKQFLKDNDKFTIDDEILYSFKSNVNLNNQQNYNNKTNNNENENIAHLSYQEMNERLKYKLKKYRPLINASNSMTFSKLNIDLSFWIVRAIRQMLNYNIYGVVNNVNDDLNNKKTEDTVIKNISDSPIKMVLFTIADQLYFIYIIERRFYGSVEEFESYYKIDTMKKLIQYSNFDLYKVHDTFIEKINWLLPNSYESNNNNSKLQNDLNSNISHNDNSFKISNSEINSYDQNISNITIEKLDRILFFMHLLDGYYTNSTEIEVIENWDMQKIENFKKETSMKLRKKNSVLPESIDKIWNNISFKNSINQIKEINFSKRKPNHIKSKNKKPEIDVNNYNKSQIMNNTKKNMVKNDNNLFDTLLKYHLFLFIVIVIIYIIYTIHYSHTNKND